VLVTELGCVSNQLSRNILSEDQDMRFKLSAALLSVAIGMGNGLGADIGSVPDESRSEKSDFKILY
jgi:hypothetical protein